MARRALGPATLAVVQAVDAALGSDDRALLVACSGGADSLALAFGAQHVAGRRRLPCAAVVVDHQLQPSSASVAAAAATALRQLGLTDVRVRPVRVERNAGQGPEAAARAARYAALHAEARTLAGSGSGSGSDADAATVLLGHTREDQAETVLLGLARGSGTRSLAGMAPRSGLLVRPLLDVPRSTTAQACAELGLQPWQDPHNADPGYARVRVRNQVLPVLETALGPGVAQALARTAYLARDDADLLDALAADADPGEETLPCAVVTPLPAALRRRVLRRWLLARGAEEPALTHVLAVEDLLLRWHGQRGVHVPGGVVARRAGELLWQAVARA